MNVDDKTIEPSTDLALALGNSNQHVSNDSGAGANAVSRVDMRFIATSPLSELVWSPHKGLCLKCADGSTCRNKPLLLWDVGPSNMTTGAADREELFIEENLDTSPEAFSGRGVAVGENCTHFLASDEGILQMSGSNKKHKRDEPAFDGNRTSEEPTAKERDLSIENQKIGREIVLVSEACNRNECEASDRKVMNAVSPEKVHEESSSSVAKLRKAKMDGASPAIFSMERLDSTNNNDLHIRCNEDSCDVAAKIVAPDHADEVESNSEQDEGILQKKDKTFEARQSPTNSRDKRYQMKGKAKALSDGNVNEGMLDENESHESVESCNSAMLSSSRMKRWRSEPELTVGRKSAKTKVEQSPGSKDSSFMNWISNMMKGFLKSNQAELPSRALTMGYYNHEIESCGDKLISCSRNQDSECKNMGFQSIFQSLYRSKMKPRDSTVSAEVNRTCGISATPIAFHTTIGDTYRQFLLSNEKFNESGSGNGSSPQAQTKDRSKSIAVGQEINCGNLADRKNAHSLTIDKQKDGIGSNSSWDKCNRKSAENTDSELPSEGKQAYNFGNESNPFTSLWITRFTSKTSGPPLNQDPCNKSIVEPLDQSTNGMMLKLQLHPDNQKEHPADDAAYVENYSPDLETSLGLCRSKGLPEEKITGKLSSISPSPGEKNSEAMAFVFARRLDALKHNISSTNSGTSSRVCLTCSFCGLKGHHLQDCSEITGNELKDLLNNVNSYDLAEGNRRLCIRCFQHSHWAVTCPNASSRPRKAEGSSSLLNKIDPGKVKLYATNADNSKLSDSSSIQLQESGRLAVCNVNDTRMYKKFNLVRELNEAASSRKAQLKRKLFDNDTVSHSKENSLKEQKISPLSHIARSEISEVQKGIFDAVKSLRLSRTDILKWMNSLTPFSRIDGLFLRLRLGKWEEELGGTGYYVACISGIQRRGSMQKSRVSIVVDVGGIKCSVDSKYVSNHDFLEDELMAWWSATLSSGGKIPSEEDLRLKLKDKRELGF